MRKNHARFPLLGLLQGQRTFLPLALLLRRMFLPPGVRRRTRKPDVRAIDFLDLDLFVQPKAGFPALTFTTEDLCVDTLPHPRFNLGLNELPVV